uniref:DNA2/NAM7 helicase helicase domain-containing protein n=1 Tax=Phlebotomus papatasi TaxID=29031 RepID=A0A1B0GQE3_PHLPP
MNEKQFEAFQLGLTRKLSLIQGPPGTGKSAVALNIVQRILEKTSCTILVVTFQKYNLDKFLMDCSALTEKILHLYKECRGARIIGMTTTGIAKYSCLLKLIRPSVVIMEEAENSPECQVITALTEYTQQLIFVGEAKRIGFLKDLHFEIPCRNTSLFERLVENDINNILL